MEILFINSCVRGKDRSRSKKIADAFLAEIKAINGNANITEIDLMEINPPYMTYSNFEQNQIIYFQFENQDDQPSTSGLQQSQDNSMHQLRPISV